MSSRLATALAGGAFVAATLTAVSWRGAAPRPPLPASAPTTASETAAVPVHAAPPAAAPDAVPTPMPSRELLLPDGGTVPTLNDAVDAAPLGHYWGPFPWSPIVGVERSSAGVDWYRHADGSFSTTQMVWREDLGKHAAMTRVAHPGPGPAAPAPARGN